MNETPLSYTITVNMPTTTNVASIIREMQKYKRRDDDGDGSAGVAAMVPAGPRDSSGGMFLDQPA